MLHRLLLASLTLATGAVLAQDVRLYDRGEKVNPHDVARILDRSTPPPMKMRGIRLIDDAAAPSAQQLAHAAGTSAHERPQADALALQVQFDFDSSEILPSARPQLDALAAGIRMLPAGQSVVIEGHTDATGPGAYNEKLSLQRAHAVKSYLVALHRIEPARLHTQGLGEHAPLRGRDPYAPENRRVQFRGE